MSYHEPTRTPQTSTLATEYKDVYGYIRISDVKQEQGASREAQQEAIQRYAQQNNLNIISWYTETQTAATTGRPEFNAMINNIRRGKAKGFIGHKIDRTSRNFEDWSRMLKLHKQGYEIHFAHESVNLSEHSGLLSANIQLVMACDYIENLRQEVVKGMYRRLEEGYYPWSAPVGYVNNGRGKLKTPHPVYAPLVKKLFELYAGGYTILKLVDTMKELGLKNHRGKTVKKNGIINILTNPFYMGIINVKGQTYIGKHEAIISAQLYKKAGQQRIKRVHAKVKKHNFLFRRTLHCRTCQQRLVGELQKGRVYYRCHTKRCSNSVREDSINEQIRTHLNTIELSTSEARVLQGLADEYFTHREREQKSLEGSLRVQDSHIAMKLSKLTDTYLDGGIQRALFETKKHELLEQQREIQEQRTLLKQDESNLWGNISTFLELAKNLTKSYDSANMEYQRELLHNVFSNFSVEAKKLYVTMKYPYSEIAKLRSFRECTHSLTRHRTSETTDTASDSQPSKRKLSKSQLRNLFEKILLNLNSPPTI